MDMYKKEYNEPEHLIEDIIKTVKEAKEVDYFIGAMSVDGEVHLFKSDLNDLETIGLLKTLTDHYSDEFRIWEEEDEG